MLLEETYFEIWNLKKKKKKSIKKANGNKEI